VVDLVDNQVDLVAAEREEADEIRGAHAEAAGVAVEPDATEVEGDEVEAGAVGPGISDGSEAAELFDIDDPSGLSPIDPRIRDRRVAVTRAEGRRRLRILLIAVSVFSVIGIAWLVVQSPFLALESVNVHGASRETKAAVEAAAGVRERTALLFVDTGAVARRVEKLPWVADAKVHRNLPDELEITVVERLPVAWARRGVPSGSPPGTLGVAVLIDRSGRVLGDEPQPPVGLPELVGLPRVPKRGDRIEPTRAATALAQLPDALRAQTGSLHRRGGEAVLKLVALPGGALPAAGEVRLGNFEAIGPKGAAALAVLDQLTLEGEEVGYIDVRVPGAPATGE
jgi:cell division protein FtsQ